MRKKAFKWFKFLLFLIAILSLAASAFALRHWQQERIKNKALKTGLESYGLCKWESAAGNLGRYLTFDRANTEILLKYADAQMHIRPLGQDNVQQAVSAYRTILREDRANKQAVLKLSDVYLELDIPAEAELITKRFLEQNDDVEIKTFLAISLARQRKYPQAADLLKQIINNNPYQIKAYDTMVRVAQSDPDGRYENPEYWLNLCIENNPHSAQAFILRASYYLQNNKQQESLDDLANAERFDLSDPNVRIELANQYIRNENFSKAKEHLDQIGKINQTLPSLWELRALIAHDEDSKSEMLHVAHSAMKALENDPWDFMPIAAELLIYGGEIEKGKTYINKMKVKGIDPPTVKWLQGLIAISENKDYEAIRILTTAQKMGYDSEKITPELVNTLLKVGDDESALVVLRQQTIEMPQSYKWHIELATLALQQQYAETLHHSKIALSIRPGSVEPLILNYKAQISMPQTTTQSSRCEKLKNISEHLSNLTGLSDQYPEIEFLKFTCSLECQDFEKAEKILTDLQKSETNSIDLELAYVDLFLAKGKTEEAIAKLTELIRQYPQDILPVIYLSNVLVKSGNPQQSETIILKALDSAENNETKRKLILLLSDIYSGMSETAKLHTFLDNKLRQMPEDIPIRKKLLDLYINENRYVPAQAIIEEIKKIEGLQGWQWKYEQARLWFDDKYFDSHYRQILGLLQQNLADNPDDNVSRLLLASVYEKASENQLALITYRAAMNHNPYDMNIKTHIINSLFKAKEFDNAQALLNDAIKEDYVNAEVLKLNLRNLLRQNKISSAIDFIKGIDASIDSKKSINLLLANLKIKEGDYQQARQILDELAAQDPNSVKVKSLLVQLNLRTKNNTEAVKLCDEIISNKKEASAFLLRADTYASIGETDAAQKDFDLASTMEPNNADILEARGIFYSSIGKYDLAFGDMEKAYQLQLSNIEILKYMLNSLPDINNPENILKCRRLLEHALENYPTDPELLWYKARLLIAENISTSTTLAENILEDITKDNPVFPSAWSLLAEIYLNQDEAGKAMNTILQGLKYCPSDKNMLLIKAKIEMQSSPEIAALTLEHLHQQQPENGEILFLFANTYIAAGQSQKAVQLLTDYEQQCPTQQKEKTGAALAMALYKNGETENAQNKLNQLSASNQNFFDIFMVQSEILYDRQNWDELKKGFETALHQHPECADRCLKMVKKFLTSKNNLPPSVSEYLLREILKYKPDNTPALEMLAINLHINDRIEEAAQYYEKTLEIDPNDKIALNNLAWIMCENYNKFHKSLELADYGLKIYPEYASLTDTRGSAYYRLGEYKKASDDFLKSIQLNDKKSSSYVISLFHLARTLNQMGNTKYARAYMEKAVSLNQIQGGLSITEVAEAQNIINLLPDKIYDITNR